MRTILMVCLALLTHLPAVAAERDSSYLCISDEATGFSYDKSLKKWGSGSFNVEDMRYILKRDGASKKWRPQLRQAS